MSLGIVIKGPEGLVLAAESRLILTASAQQGAPPVHASFDNTTKVFGFGSPNNRIGVVTYGLGAIGLRSVYSFMPEFEQGLPEGRLAVAAFACKLSEFLQKQWKGAMPEDYSGPPLTVVIAGFDEGEAYGKVNVIEIPNAPEPKEQNAGPGEFGITWGGQREIVDRLIQGYDDRVLSIARQTLTLPQQHVDRLRQELRSLTMQLPLAAMPLQDCIDLAIFFVRTTVEAQRLTVGIRGCGGPIDVATITREQGMSFVQRKQLRGEVPTVGEV